MITRVKDITSWILAFFVAALLAGIYALASGSVPLLTPDQRGYRDFERPDYEQAVVQFGDTMWMGVALFKLGEFEQSAGVFAGLDTADSSFNQGNALVMQGKYVEAAEKYSRALELRPDWDDAIANREIALGRAARLKQEGGDMTGGMLAADDIVFTTGDSPPSSGEEQTEGGQEMSDAELRAVWLRQVQTKPADFLAAKFAYQHAMRPEPEVEQNADKLAPGE